MSNRLARIADLLGKDQATAALFCKEVQKFCKGQIPSFEEIHECLKLHPQFKSDARAIAERVVHTPKMRNHKPPKVRKVGKWAVKVSSIATRTPEDIARHQRLYGDWTTD